jgi:hypothetical protein
MAIEPAGFEALMPGHLFFLPQKLRTKSGHCTIAVGHAKLKQSDILAELGVGLKAWLGLGKDRHHFLL